MPRGRPRGRGGAGRGHGRGRGRSRVDSDSDEDVRIGDISKKDMNLEAALRASALEAAASNHSGQHQLSNSTFSDKRQRSAARFARSNMADGLSVSDGESSEDATEDEGLYADSSSDDELVHGGRRGAAAVVGGIFDALAPSDGTSFDGSVFDVQNHPSAEQLSSSGGGILTRYGDVTALTAGDGGARHRFREGDLVEVPYTDDGFQYSYYSAHVRAVYQYSLEVQFLELTDNAGDKHISRVPIAAVRPPVPAAPAPTASGSGSTPPAQYSPGDFVDISTADGWWRAHVLRAVPKEEWNNRLLPLLTAAQGACTVVRDSIAAGVPLVEAGFRPKLAAGGVAEQLLPVAFLRVLLATVPEADAAGSIASKSTRVNNLRTRLTALITNGNSSVAACGVVYHVTYTAEVARNDEATDTQLRRGLAQEAWLRGLAQTLSEQLAGRRTPAKRAGFAAALEGESAANKMALCSELAAVFNQHGNPAVDLIALGAGAEMQTFVPRSIFDCLMGGPTTPAVLSHLPCDAAGLAALAKGGLPVAGTHGAAPEHAVGALRGVTIPPLTPPVRAGAQSHDEGAASVAARFPQLHRLLRAADDVEAGLPAPPVDLSEGSTVRDSLPLVAPGSMRAGLVWCERNAPGKGGALGSWMPRMAWSDPDRVPTGAFLWHIRRVFHLRSAEGRAARIAAADAAKAARAEAVSGTAAALRVIKSQRGSLAADAAKEGAAEAASAVEKEKRVAAVKSAQVALRAATNAFAAVPADTEAEHKKHLKSEVDKARRYLDMASAELRSAEGSGRGGARRRGRGDDSDDEGGALGELPPVTHFLHPSTPLGPAEGDRGLHEAAVLFRDGEEGEEAAGDRFAELGAAAQAALSSSGARMALGLVFSVDILEERLQEEEAGGGGDEQEGGSPTAAGDGDQGGDSSSSGSGSGGDDSDSDIEPELADGAVSQDSDSDAGDSVVAGAPLWPREVTVSRQQVSRRLGLGGEGLDCTEAQCATPAELPDGDRWERNMTKARTVRAAHRCGVSGRSDEEGEEYAHTLQAALRALGGAQPPAAPATALRRRQKCRSCALSVGPSDAWLWLGPGRGEGGSHAQAPWDALVARTHLGGSGAKDLPAADAVTVAQGAVHPPYPCLTNYALFGMLAPAGLAGAGATLLRHSGALPLADDVQGGALSAAEDALRALPPAAAVQTLVAAPCLLCRSGRRAVEKIYAHREVRLRRNLPVEAPLFGPGGGELGAVAAAATTAWQVVRTREYWVKWAGRGHWHNCWVREQTLEHILKEGLNAYHKRCGISPLFAVLAPADDPSDPGVEAGTADVRAVQKWGDAAAAVRFFLRADGAVLWSQQVPTTPPYSVHKGVLLSEDEGTGGATHRAFTHVDSTASQETPGAADGDGVLLASPPRRPAGGTTPAEDGTPARGEAAPSNAMQDSTSMSDTARRHLWRAEFASVSHVLARRRRVLLPTHAKSDPRTGGVCGHWGLPLLRKALQVACQWPGQSGGPSAGQGGGVPPLRLDGDIGPEAEWAPHEQYEYLVKWNGLDHGGATWEWGPLVALFAAPEITRWAAINTRRMRELTPAALASSHAVLGAPNVVGVGPKAAAAAAAKNGSASAASVFKHSPAWLGGELFPYQLAGLNWLYTSYKDGRGVILADEMGLGKTVQALALLEAIHQLDGGPAAGPHLVVVPKSTIGNWFREARLWAPGLVVSMYTGYQTDRSVIRDTEWYVTDINTGRPVSVPSAEGRAGKLVAIDVLLISYELVCSDLEHIRAFQSSVRHGTRMAVVKVPSGDADAGLAATGLKQPWNADLEALGLVRGKGKGKGAAVARAAGRVFGALVIDEGHSLKGKGNSRGKKASRRFDALAELQVEHRVLLTGTPLQNRMEELWALLFFLHPERFSDCDAFLEQFGDLADPTALQEFHGVLRPHMLRRVKTEVMKDLPAKHEVIIPIALAPQQRHTYKNMLTRNYDLVHSRGASKSALSNLVMTLRHVANHPYIAGGMEAEMVGQVVSAAKAAAAKADAAAGGEGGDPAAGDAVLAETASSLGLGDIRSVRLLARARQDASDRWRLPPAAEFSLLVNCAGKVQLLTKLLPELGARGHRVLVFSQFKLVLDILEDVLLGLLHGYADEEVVEGGAPAGGGGSTAAQRNAARHRLRYRRIDGDTPGQERERIISLFNKEDSPLSCLLMSTRAGGMGLNLATADTVIIFDSDWNPHMDRQAAARVHRYGQKKPVCIYRLVTVGTVEEKMQEKAAQKLQMERVATAGVGSGGDAAAAKAPTREELLDAIKMSVKVFQEDDKAQAAARKLVSEPGAVAGLVSSADAEAAAKTAAGPDATAEGEGASLFNVFSVVEGGEEDAAAAAAGGDDGVAEAEALWAARFQEMRSEREAERLAAAAAMGRGKRSRTSVRYVEMGDAAEEGSRARKAARAGEEDAAAAAAAAAGDDGFEPDGSDGSDDDVELAAEDSEKQEAAPPSQAATAAKKPSAAQAAARKRSRAAAAAAAKAAAAREALRSTAAYGALAAQLQREQVMAQQQMLIGSLMSAITTVLGQLGPENISIAHRVAVHMQSVLPAATLRGLARALPLSMADGAEPHKVHASVQSCEADLPEGGAWRLMHPVARGAAAGTPPLVTAVHGLTVAPSGYEVPFLRVGEEPNAKEPPALVQVPVYQLRSAELIAFAGGLPSGAARPQSEGFLCPTEALMERELFVCGPLGKPSMAVVKHLRQGALTPPHIKSVFMTLRGACLCDHCVLTRHVWRDLKPGASAGLLEPRVALSVRDRIVASTPRVDPHESRLAVGLNCFCELMYEVRQHLMLNVIRELYESAAPVLPPNMQPAVLLPAAAAAAVSSTGSPVNSAEASRAAMPTAGPTPPHVGTPATAAGPSPSPPSALQQQ